jgi:hypothetical protein
MQDPYYQLNHPNNYMRRLALSEAQYTRTYFHLMDNIPERDKYLEVILKNLNNDRAKLNFRPLTRDEADKIAFVSELDPMNNKFWTTTYPSDYLSVQSQPPPPVGRSFNPFRLFSKNSASFGRRRGKSSVMSDIVYLQGL